MTWLMVTGGALLISAAFSYALARYQGRWSVLDPVNARSLHTVPVPRTGGLAILLGILFAAAWVLLRHAYTEPVLSLVLIIVACVLVAGASLMDDFTGLGIVSRLVTQMVAALLVMVAGLYISVMIPGVLMGQSVIVIGVLLAVLFVVWITNLYNFMDGMDGLAAGMTVFGFGTFALLGVLTGHPGFALFNAGVAASGLGFLLFNFPPARIFMGDVGSASLGFLAAVMMLWAEHRAIFSLWVGIVVFSPFIVDATWTLVRRSLYGRKPWQAHREHFYQRLVLGGWSHRKTLACEYLVMALCALLAVYLARAKALTIQYFLLGGVTVLYLGLAMLINVWEVDKKHHRTVSGPEA